MPKLTIRQSTFETNSSSVHSLVIAKDGRISDDLRNEQIVVFDDYYVPTREEVIDIRARGLDFRAEQAVLNELRGERDDIFEACNQETWRYGNRRRTDGTALSDFKRRFETAVMYLPSAKYLALSMIHDQLQSIRPGDDGSGDDGDVAFDADEKKRLERECRKHPCRDGAIAALLDACEKHGVDVKLAIDADALCDAYEVEFGNGRTIIDGAGGVSTAWIHGMKEIDGYSDLAANEYKRLVDFVMNEDSQAYIVAEGDLDYDRYAYGAIGTFRNDGEKRVNGKYEVISKRLS